MRSLPPDLARRALESAPDAMIIIGSSGVIGAANRQTYAMFGYSEEELIGQPVEHLMAERFHGRHRADRESYMRSPRPRPMGAGLELFGRRKDGSEFPLEISLSPIEDQTGSLVAAAIRDVTDRKLIETDLVRAREEATRANLAKSRFLATASHDLRQPLQTVSMLNGTLSRVVGHGPITAAMAAISQQAQAINAMSRLLGALLDISKLESGAIRPDITDFAVDGLLEEMRREFDDVAANKGLSLNVQTQPLMVHSDRSLVEQVLRNLVSNAIKYTREGWVRLRSLKDGSLVHVEVLDTGIGISNDQIAHIYEEFYQVGVAPNTSRDGYGLGLSIVQRIVNLLELELDVSSNVGKGSRFTLTLPVGAGPVAPNAGKPLRNPIGRAPGRNSHVLLVEDDADVREATRMLLRTEDYEVTAVASLAEALSVATDRTHSFDVVITDYHLGNGETGMQVIAGLRARLGESLKAVLVTGDTSTAMHELSRDPLMRLASKPMEADQLLELLRGLAAQ
jgi:two-component system, sensor histidine kinase